MNPAEKYERFSLEKFEPSRIFQIMRNILFQAMRSDVMQKFDELGLSFNQRNALIYISRNNNCTPGELSKMLCQETASISRLIRSLEMKKLILRVDHDQDRRKRHLKVTSTGQELTKKIGRVPISKIAKMTAQLSKAEKKILWYGLQIILEGFSKTK